MNDTLAWSLDQKITINDLTFFREVGYHDINQ
jgi:hypothetical protein